MPCPAARGDGESLVGRRTRAGRAVCEEGNEEFTGETEMGYFSRSIIQHGPCRISQSPSPPTASATARSFPRDPFKLSVVNRKGKTAPPTQFPGGKMEGKCYLVWFMLIQTSLLPHLFKYTWAVSISEPPSPWFIFNTSKFFHLIIIFSKVKLLWETLKMEITVWSQISFCGAWFLNCRVGIAPSECSGSPEKPSPPFTVTFTPGTIVCVEDLELHRFF